ncbi:MAG: GNAT family N-acetyltransferase [Paraglaciecola sp.]|uniref:GNAT family N-acetyltransferase n=1 Tax=Pseudomonadati TaxID=3379134 RepID=UPI00273F8746|nr:GNAT family N-acetyltransferase [Paraglaciecola sp.]MDP5031746.1 GNAT family N-acetyltransferase [Paraglaciecola sp.]MDP5132881.1 GNAT family N-acetyltransferase [Paraglaciecola sp.]
MAFTVRNVDWGNEEHKLRKIREKIFVCQWRIPIEYEFDQQDHGASHVLVVDENNQEVATGRITPTGEIGRIAVEPQFRGPEVYQLLFKALISIAEQQGLQQVQILCELEGVNYYQQQGFRSVGSVFMDAGVPRQCMTCGLANFTLNKVEYTH